jgi:NADH-quinone oxidoreductase subunit L
MNVQLIKFLPWLPAIGAVLCGLCCTHKSLRKAAGPISVLSIFLAFLLAVGVYSGLGDRFSEVVHAFTWMHVGNFQADFAYFIDPLTIVMLFVVCGIGTLVALYATGYMAGEKGYARFFAGVSLFIFAMTTLVMADNLVLLYLGWEGVGLCSYLLIGYYYDKPSAVAAAKKAFIVNRVGDLGFALGIFLTYTTFDTVSLSEVVRLAREVGGPEHATTAMLWIPFLLMLGAFGKSAQLPLYVWLPDAMEGPTPVSALIHAATMVTAGVYMIARLVPVFQLSPYALPTVAAVGGLTALFAATIALCQYDLKRIYAYSTISQLGYMFLGVGALSTFGGVFHLMTHAFFKALLFLTAGSVMHALAGQLDLRKISGLRKKMPVTCWLMFIGCLALAGFPFTAGFYSKDLILAETLIKGQNGDQLYFALALVGIFTAFLTAFYTFRLWFRVFMGPEQYEMGHEHHGADEHADHAHDAAGHAHDAGHAHHDAHEMPFFPMNLPLVVLAIGALIAGVALEDWMETSIEASTANPIALVADAEHRVPAGEHAIALVAAAGDHAADAAHNAAASVVDAAGPAESAHHATLFGMDLHIAMQIISGAIALCGIALAAYFHWFKREAADAVANATRPIVSLLNHKYYVDELYDLAIVRPLRTLGHIFFVLDQLLIDGLVYAVAWAPRLVGRGVQPSQSGRLQGYGLGMVFGLGAIAVLILFAIT